MAPFIIASRTLPPATALDFGVKVHTRAPAVIFPALGAYVGGDIVAGLLATGLTRDRRIRLFIDVGTNSEIVLGSVERVVATAAPAGPAFEAAQIRCGMRAADGAIESVKIADDDAHARRDRRRRGGRACAAPGSSTPSRSWCGVGLIDKSGRFIPDEDAAERFPVLASNLVKVGRSACSCCTGVARIRPSRCSCRSATCASCSSRRRRSRPAGTSSRRSSASTPNDVSQVLLAGSFGSYLTPASAIRIGLVPRLAPTRIVSAGNVAGEGAKMIALSHRERAAADAILEEVEYVELSGRTDFNDAFIDMLAFPG